MGNQISVEEAREIARETRKLYRTTLTEEEAQAGWVRLLVAQNSYNDSCGVLDATYYEFTWRMNAMGIQYTSFDKLAKALEKLNEKQD